MTEYVWRNATYESVIKEPAIKPILLTIKTLKKEWFTKKEIYDKGKERNFPGFPTSPDTVLRALNSMSLPGVEILQKKVRGKGLSHRWKLIKSPFLFEELIVENEIFTIAGIAEDYILEQKQGVNWANIIADESTTIYGFPLHNFSKFEKDFNQIRSKLKNAMDELRELTEKSRQCILIEMIERFKDSYKKNIPPLDYYLGFIIIRWLFGERLAKVDKSGGKLCIMSDWFDGDFLEGNEPIGVKENLDLVNVLRDNFYPSKQKAEILGMFKDYKIGKKISNEIKIIFRFALSNVMPCHLIAVVHGGVCDRFVKFTPSYSDLYKLVDDGQRSTYHDLSERYRNSAHKKFGDLSDLSKIFDDIWKKVVHIDF